MPSSTFGASGAALRWICAIRAQACRGPRISFGCVHDADGIFGRPTLRLTVTRRNRPLNLPRRTDSTASQVFMNPLGGERPELDDDFEDDPDEDDLEDDDVDRDDDDDDDEEPDDEEGETWQVRSPPPALNPGD